MVDWPNRRAFLPTCRLRGKRVGLHGFGAVARELVAMLRPFGAGISAYSPGVPHAILQQNGVEPADSLESLFARSDVLIECEALTRATEGTVSENVLRHLPVGAVFVNVGRGRVVDEEALARVAGERGLRLGIDVFQKEPPSPQSSLLRVPDAIFSPHIAGPTMDAFTVLWEFAMENLSLYMHGKELQGLVTLDVFDRST
jgi:phosphoglycerate dehydrogenase-like enzyme